MKKTSFLKKLTAMAATLAMTCVMAVGAFAAEPAVDYKLDSDAINVGETWTMSVPAGGMYDWNLSSEYIAYGPSMADKEGVLKQVGYETANGVSTITYEAMMPGTCTVTLTDRSFAKIAEATVTVTDGQRRARHAQRRYAEHRQQGCRNARRSRRTVCRCSGEHRPR